MHFIHSLILLSPLYISTLQAAPAFDRRAEKSAPLDKFQQFVENWNGYLCIGACRELFGWAGHHLNRDRWGNVLVLEDPLAFIPSPLRQQPGDAPNTRLPSPTDSFDPVITEVPSSNTTATSSITPITTPTTVPSSTSFSQGSSAQTATAIQADDSDDDDSGPPDSPASDGDPDSSAPSKPNITNVGGKVPENTIQDERALYLKEHNKLRSAHKAPPLTYSTDLENDAQTVANSCQFKHSGFAQKRGENIAAKPGDFPITQLFGFWTQEGKNFDPKKPKASHFTQAVWKNSTQVGCANQVCNGIFPGKGPATFHVCQYSPRGNIKGQFRFNVAK